MNEINMIKKSIIQRVERHIVVNNPTVDNLCFLSKNLYNYCNYILRQVYFQKFDNILEFRDLVKEFKNKDRVLYKVEEYDLTTRLTKMKQLDFKALPNNTSQQIIKLLYQNWNSFYKLLKIQSKLNGHPKMPKYKDKTNGKNIIVFTNIQVRLKEGFIHFPKKCQLEPVKTKVTNICQVRIVPQATCYVIEVVYKKEVVENEELDEKLYMGIDLGINNLATCVNNVGLDPFIINGKIVKSINQYYNKTKARLQSLIKVGTSKRIKRLTLKRNCKIEDYFHKTSRFIINYCLEHHIKTIVIGKNDGWKTEVNLGRVTNQKFVGIPFNKLISQLKYKGEEVGIGVVETEESYTSKCSFIDLEKIEHAEEYCGRRIKRGMFVSKLRKKINADVNGAYNIVRKVVPEIFNDQGIEGLGLNPIIINLTRVNSYE
jgi:putative transposase